MRAREAARPTGLETARRGADAGFTALLLAGVFVTPWWRPGIVLVVAGVLGLLVSHVVVGIVSYRRVMARTWPRVEPRHDDDDDW